MRITYIGHSGFAAEWEDIVCLFDFAEGELRSMLPHRMRKPLPRRALKASGN